MQEKVPLSSQPVSVQTKVGSPWGMKISETQASTHVALMLIDSQSYMSAFAGTWLDGNGGQSCCADTRRVVAAAARSMRESSIVH